jgi:hypothetical protein
MRSGATHGKLVVRYGELAVDSEHGQVPTVQAVVVGPVGFQ